MTIRYIAHKNVMDLDYGIPMQMMTEFNIIHR